MSPCLVHLKSILLLDTVRTYRVVLRAGRASLPRSSVSYFAIHLWRCLPARTQVPTAVSTLSTQLCRLELFTIDLARLMRTAAPLGRPFDINCWSPRGAPAGADWLRCGASGSPSALGVLGLKVSATSPPCGHLCNFGVRRYFTWPLLLLLPAPLWRDAVGRPLSLCLSVCSTPAGRWVPRYGVLPLWIS